MPGTQKDSKDAPKGVIKTTDLAPGKAFEGSKTDEEVGKLPELVTPEMVNDDPAHKPEDTVSLTGPGGTKVTVHKDQGDTLKAMGYK